MTRSWRLEKMKTGPFSEPVRSPFLGLPSSPCAFMWASRNTFLVRMSGMMISGADIWKSRGKYGVYYLFYRDRHPAFVHRDQKKHYVGSGGPLRQFRGQAHRAFDRENRAERERIRGISRHQRDPDQTGQ